MVFRLIIVLFFFSVGAFSQEKFIKHKISKGENLTVIAKKYGLKAKDIKEANPDAPKVLKLNSILLIPNKNAKPSQNTPQTIANNTSGSHEVLQKETLWGIAKKYNVSVDDLKKANPTLETEGLKIGQQLNIPSNKPVISENTIKTNEARPEIIPAAEGEIIVEVQPKETKFSIAKKYGITVAELERQNPFIKRKLAVGYMLKIRTSAEKANQNIKDASAAQTQAAEKTVTNNTPGADLKPNNTSVTVSENVIKADGGKPEINPAADVEVVVEVQPKETKYAIAKKYGITVKELERQNPFIKGKLPVGYVLKIRTTKEKADALNAVSSPATQLENPTTETTTQIADNTVIKKDSTFVYNGNHSDLIDQLILNATENIGTRYRSGGTTKAGFDCSGLMFCTYGNFDIKLPRSSIEQSRIGTKVATTEAQKGDLIFFKTNGRRQINHVGMVVENTDGEIKFVHSSTHGGVMISSTKEAYYQRAFSQINRILE
ncbi:Cell wall-associated hydrolase, NlpC family [Flavobacterium sp. CF108]|uniref:C40 family peptidase n=1 Tax=unclassified Flavobacterium TaxID=196869 RepID=UPI0008CCB98C|nr:MULTISPECIES: LysM peptidoglycan-binding domain-containing protein [unclassified Flavobacterium]SEP21343.1 Cell wall-associated hydrolase, NlpC family [Flavobacterium sp. fv08]SHI08754.1 Cell wall-associated hydrolase, NlpC family [Flavobacterium sp. CF108]